MKKILILEANPHQYLFLDKEIRELRRVIDEASDRTKFLIKDGAAARKDKLHELLLALEDKEPKDESIIVHFCGHGIGEKGLVFEDHKGESDLVGTKTLADFFELFKDKVACVVMNACYSEKQAKAINKHIKYVIGMNQAIRDDTAIAFSIGFYRALGYGKSFENAFKFGKNAIQLVIDDGLKNQDAIAKEMRKLIAVGDVSEANIIPEHLIPILAINQNLMIPNSISPKPQAKINEQAIAIWRRKLDFLETKLPTASVNEEFTILENIKECKHKIQELGG